MSINTSFLCDLPTNVFIGKHFNERFYLRRPSWDCGWYWGFGYIGNNRCHHHLNWLDGIDSNVKSNTNLFDQLTQLFGDTFIITDERDKWQFCEIVKTIYTLRKTAELCHRGGSHYTQNPDVELLKDSQAYEHINHVLIPAQIKSMYAILNKYR